MVSLSDLICDFEHLHRDTLQRLHNDMSGLWGGLCEYKDFVVFCYEHSS